MKGPESYLSFLLLSRVAQFDVLDFVYLLGVDDQPWVKGVQLLGHLEILSGCVVVLESFIGKGPSEVGVAIFSLQSDHFGVIFQRFLELVSQQVALSPFVDVTRLIVGQLYGFGQRRQRLFIHLKVGVRDTQVIVDIGLISLEGMVIQGGIQILDGLLELFVAIIRQPSLVQDLRICWLPAQSIGQVIDCLAIQLYVDVDVASLYQKLFIRGLSPHSFVQIVKSLFIVLQKSIGLADSFENTCILRSQLFRIQKIFNGILVLAFPELGKLNFGYAPQEVSFRIGGFDLCGLIEVFNGLLIILDILIDQASALIDQPVFSNSIQDFSQTFQGSCQFPALMLHQTQVIEAGNVVVGHFQSFLKHLYGLVVLQLILVGETFAVIELGVVGHQLDGFIEVIMGLLVLAQSQISIATIKQSPRIRRVQPKRLVIFHL